MEKLFSNRVAQDFEDNFLEAKFSLMPKRTCADQGNNRLKCENHSNVLFENLSGFSILETFSLYVHGYHEQNMESAYHVIFWYFEKLHTLQNWSL